jgi:hypothetical protein
LTGAEASVTERLNQLATISVARGVGFAGLAIVCTMVGFSGSLPALLKAGGLGAALVTTVLIMKASTAPRVSHRRTEIWLMLEAHERPPADFAQRMIVTARRSALIRFALASAWVATALLSLSLVARLAGFR